MNEEAGVRGIPRQAMPISIHRLHNDLVQLENELNVNVLHMGEFDWSVNLG
jgi:hypothetical protein